MFNLPAKIAKNIDFIGRTNNNIVPQLESTPWSMINIYSLIRKLLWNHKFSCLCDIAFYYVWYIGLYASSLKWLETIFNILSHYPSPGIHAFEYGTYNVQLNQMKYSTRIFGFVVKIIVSLLIFISISFGWAIYRFFVIILHVDWASSCLPFE